MQSHYVRGKVVEYNENFCEDIPVFGLDVVGPLDTCVYYKGDEWKHVCEEIQVDLVIRVVPQVDVACTHVYCHYDREDEKGDHFAVEVDGAAFVAQHLAEGCWDVHAHSGLFLELAHELAVGYLLGGDCLLTQVNRHLVTFIIGRSLILTIS